MKRLLKIELHKTLYSPVFWIMLGLYVLLFVLASFTMNYIISNSSNNGQSAGQAILQQFSIFSFPNIWHNLAFLAGWFKLLLAVIIITLVINEFNYRTLQQNIIDGMSQWETIWAKEIIIVLLSLVATFVLTVTVLILGDNSAGVFIFEGIEFVVAYFITLLLYLNFVYFLCVFIKRSGLVIAILLGYSLIVEPIITYYLPEIPGNFFPMRVMVKMIPNPFGELVGMATGQENFPVYIIVSFVYCTLFITGIHWFLKKGYVRK